MSVLNYAIAENIVKGDSFGDIVAKSIDVLGNPFSSPVGSPEHAAEYFRSIWNRKRITDQEQVYVIFIDDQGMTIDWRCLFTGGRNSVNADEHVIIRETIRSGARGFFMAHNHPTGKLSPSQADKNFTKRLNLMCEIVKVDFFDHIIIGPNEGYYSFLEGGLLKEVK